MIENVAVFTVSAGQAAETARGKSGSKTLVTHRGTNEHIEEILNQGYIKAYEPRTKADEIKDHSKKAVWFNIIFSGMVGKRGEASVTFEVDSSLLKRPNGILKRWYGRIQRVIEEDVSIPQNVVVKFGGKR